MGIRVVAPFDVYTGLDGLPIDAGSIYVGVANQNPEIAPVSVYWDEANTIPAAQPIATLHGYPSRSGTPARIYVSGDYSITVRDKRGRFLYNSPSQLENTLTLPPGTANDQPASTAFVREAIDAATPASVGRFGALGDGVADDTAAFAAAIASKNVLYIPPGVYIVDHLAINKNLTIYGAGAGSSIIRKKPNSVGTGYTGDTHSYLFDITSGNCTVQFEGLTLDGNHPGQVTTYLGATPGNTSGAVQNFVAGATVLATGGAIKTTEATALAPTDTLVLRVQNCHITRCVSAGIFFEGTLDVGARQNLEVSHCLFDQAGPNIGEYHDGVSVYDGFLYQVSGYSFSASGLNSSHIHCSDSAKVVITNSTFLDTRSPAAGTVTPGYLINVYNMPACGVVVTSTNTTDPTPEWSELRISACRFEGLGRSSWQGNGIGVIDMYSRGGDAAIVGNIFKALHCSPVRGQTSARNLSVIGNVIDGVANELGINIGPNTSPAQSGNYVFANNVIRGACSGIQVVGNAAAAEDPDGNVNNVLITGNVIENITQVAISGPVFDSLQSYGMSIFVRQASEVQISNNLIDTTIAGGDNNTEDAIRVFLCDGALNITDNNLYNVAKAGVLVTNHTGEVLVDGNIVDGAGTSGVVISNTGPNSVQNNIILNTVSSGIVGGNSTATALRVINNYVGNVIANTTAPIFGIDSGNITVAGTSVDITGNYVDTVSNAGTGNASGIRIQHSALSDLNTGMLRGNTIRNVENSGVFLQNVTGALADNVFKVCNTAGATNNGAIFVNGVANTGLLRLSGNYVDGSTPPFPTTGTVTLDALRNAGVLSESNNSWNSRIVWRGAAPTAGTWGVGDIVYHSAPAASGNIGWTCVAGGSPGTWKTFGAIGA
jgi:hypothetical protein